MAAVHIWAAAFQIIHNTASSCALCHLFLYSRYGMIHTTENPVFADAERRKLNRNVSEV